MDRVLPLILGATIGATLLFVDYLIPIQLFQRFGLDYPITILVGLGVGIVLIILTDNDWFEELVGIANIDVLPDAFRWASYALFSVSLLLLVNDLTPLISRATGVPVASASVALGAYITAALTGIYKILPWKD